MSLSRCLPLLRVGLPALFIPLALFLDRGLYACDPDRADLESIVAQASTALASHAIPARSSHALPALLDRIRAAEDGRAAARALLVLYDENQKRSKRLVRRAKYLAEKRDKIPADPRSLSLQVERDLLVTSLAVVEGQLRTIDAMEVSLCLAIAELRAPASLAVLGERLKRACDSRLLAALCEPFHRARDPGAIPVLLAALDACRKESRAPIYSALARVAGVDLVHDPSTWKRWWKQRKESGGAA